MQPPLPSPTATWHNDTYSSISPTRPQLSAQGKTVIITGAGSGIGREIAVAFAAARAEKICLLGRREANLKETQAQLPKETTSFVFPVTILDLDAVVKVANEIGSWNVLILSASYQPFSKPLKEFDHGEWWQAFETNVKGAYFTARAFLPTASSSDASIIALTTGGVTMPTNSLSGQSAYISSKLALTKFFEFIAAEYPEIFAATVHPGCILTEAFHRGGIDPSQLPMDTIQLPAHFLVWMASPEATFLRGRAVWANWDVDELKSGKDTILQSLDHNAGLIGFPYTVKG